MRRFILFFLLVLALTWHESAMAQGAQIKAEDWNAYKSRFVSDSGRVIDDANGNISHSESQGYGLLLSYLAGSKADFDLIWSFTRTELLLRDDGLAVWKWDPDSTPHVTDSNNASDGDILIAYALALAGSAWDRQDLTAIAKTMIGTIGKSNVIDRQGKLVLLPAVKGFSESEREDGPIVNLSYWIFEAFAKFATLDSSTDWNKLGVDGLSLIGTADSAPNFLPADWMSMKTVLKPAKGFESEYGYNALRIPLYMVRAGIADRDQLEPFRKGMVRAGATAAIIDIPSGTAKTVLSDPGYLIIPALIDCVLDKKQVPEQLKTFKPTNYYPSTLHLLSLSFVNSHHPECL